MEDRLFREWEEDLKKAIELIKTQEVHFDYRFSDNDNTNIIGLNRSSSDQICIHFKDEKTNRRYFFGNDEDKLESRKKELLPLLQNLPILYEMVEKLAKQIEVLTKAIDPLSIALLQTEIGKELYAQICKTKLKDTTNIYQHVEQLQNIFGKDHYDEKDEKVKPLLQEVLGNVFDEFFLVNSFKERLRLLFEYEERYLELIKQHKEEILFVQSVQENLRKERTQFFSQVLQSVIKTFQHTGVDQQIASKWIDEFVESYTNSLDLSGDVAKTYFVNIMTEVRNELHSFIEAIKSSEPSI